MIFNLELIFQEKNFDLITKFEKYLADKISYHLHVVLFWIKSKASYEIIIVYLHKLNLLEISVVCCSKQNKHKTMVFVFVDVDRT